jgi:hypothetical protein
MESNRNLRKANKRELPINKEQKKSLIFTPVLICFLFSFRFF